MTFILTFLSAASAGFFIHDGGVSGSGDDSRSETFVDAIEDYGGGSADLDNCIDGAEKMLDHLDDTVFTSWELATDSSAWSWDFEEANKDDTYNDAADLGYFSGHGISSWLYFHGSSGDDWVGGYETRFGEEDVEAVAMDSCLTLDGTGRTNFINANKGEGVHWLLGFESLANDTQTTADRYGYYLKQGYDVDTSWRVAQIEGHSPTQTGSSVHFYTSSCDPYRDTLTSMSCDPTGSSTMAYEMTWSL